MISLDQVLLLEKKVESAVGKRAELQAENDALRTKCSELTNSISGRQEEMDALNNKCSELSNALSSKTEQLSSFEQDQGRIENGILKALDRLNSIENSVLKAATEPSPSPSSQAAEHEPEQTPVKPTAAAPVQAAAIQKPVQNQTINATPSQTQKPAESGTQFDIF